MPLQSTCDSHQAAGNAWAVAKFRQRGIGLRLDQLEETYFGRSIEFASGHATVWIGLHGTVAPLELEKSDDGGQADGEETSDSANRVVAALNRSDAARSLA